MIHFYSANADVALNMIQNAVHELAEHVSFINFINS